MNANIIGFNDFIQLAFGFLDIVMFLTHPRYIRLAE